MGSADSTRAEDFLLAQRSVSGEEAAVAQLLQRLATPLLRGLLSGIRVWGDLGLPPQKYYRHVVTAACRELLRAPRPSGSLAQVLEKLSLEDLYLAAGCAYGHDSAWRCFDNSFRSFMNGVVRAIAREPRDTEEILAGLYSDLFFPRRGAGGEQPSSLARYGGRATLRTWLRTVLFTRVQDFYDRQRRAPTSLDGGSFAGEGPASRPGTLTAEDRALLTYEVPEETLERRDLALHLSRALENALAGLDSEERLAFHAHFMEGRTIEEIGRVIGAHRATVGRKLKRVREKLLREVGGRLRDGTGMRNEELLGSIPDVAKEVNVNWTRILREKKKEGLS